MATLKSLVDETSNIKNELKACHTNLKNNLIAKGVECSDNDKLSSLIDKVTTLKYVKYVAGDTTQLYKNETTYVACVYDKANHVASGTKLCSYISSNDMKSVRLKAYTENYGSYYGMKFVVKIVRSGSVIATHSFDIGGRDNQKNILNISKDITDIKINDSIDFYVTYNNENLANLVKNIELTCDLLM